MGYACPVCETPQRDGEHLANHLAFTAMLGDQAHEDWLDDHAPGWGEASPDELAEEVMEHAPEAEYEEVFEDTVDRRTHTHGNPDQHGSDVEHGSELERSQSRPDVDPAAARSRGSGSLDPEAQGILRDAQEMTQQLLDEEDDDVEDDAEGDHDGEGKES
jgi:hypothetical protein